MMNPADRNDNTISLWGDDRPRRVTLTSRNDGRRYSFLLQRSLVVGRKEGFCDVRVAADDPYISKRHLRFLRDGGSIYVEDLRTRNGTALNGRPVTSREQIRRGDILKLGRTEFEVDF